MRSKLLTLISVFILSGFWIAGNAAPAPDSPELEKFQAFDAASETAIDYEVLTVWLKSAVLD